MKILFVGVNWITKRIITQMLFEDSDEELELSIIGQDTPEWFWTEFPELKKYMGDERVSYTHIDQVNDGVYIMSQTYPFNAVYVTDTEEKILDEILRTLEVKQFNGPIILASSWQVYGWKKKKRTPIPESDRDLNPENNEAKHLLELEKIMLKYKTLQTVILRYAEVFGPYMPESSEIIKMIIDCLSSEEIDVYPPPARNYDWLYVQHVETFVPKLFSRKFIGGGEIYNIGSGEEKKLTWTANALRQLTNSPARIKIEEPEGFEVEARGYHSVLDCDKAKRFLQYEPDGIRINSFLRVCRWVESDLPPEERAQLDWDQAPKLEETYPQLRPDWGTDKLQIKEEDMKS